MNTLNLSEREQVMFDVFKRRGETSVDDLIDALKKRGEKLKGGTRSMTVSVRYLGFKIAPRGYYIERVSDLGRGNKARYRLRKTGGKQ